jgi:hypothetical protein
MSDARGRQKEVTMKPERKTTLGRRNFLLALGAGTAAAAAVPLATEAVADTETYDEKRKARYRVTADVEAFYRVNRYPKARS